MNIHLIALIGVTLIALVCFRIGRKYERLDNPEGAPWELDADEAWIVKHPELLLSPEERTSKAIARLRTKQCRIMTQSQQKAKERMEQQRYRHH